MVDNLKIQNLKINSIVYCLVKSDIIPCKVIEKIISIKENGEIVKHKCKISFENQEKTFFLEDSKLKLFFSIEEARNFLLENAKKQIEQIIQTTIKLQEKYLKTPVEQKNTLNSLAEEIDFEETQEKSEEEMMVDLGDGRVQKVKISENVKKLLHQ